MEAARWEIVSGRLRIHPVIAGPLFLSQMFLLLVTGCADVALLHPWTTSINPHGATRSELRDSTGRTLEIWTARSPALAPNEPPEAFVLEFTGNGTRAEQIASYVAQRWDRHKVEAWCPNYPGYGGSTGPATLAAIAPASLQAFDAVAKEARGRPILVCGNSMGTVAALHVAAHRPVAGLVLQSPPPLRQVVVGHHGWWNLWMLATPVALGVPDDLDSIANAKRCTAPAVFVTGRNDDYVPPRYQRMVIDAYAGPKRAIEYDGDHNASPDSSAGSFRDALEWLWTRATARNPEP